MNELEKIQTRDEGKKNCAEGIFFTFGSQSASVKDEGDECINIQNLDSSKGGQLV